jgi:hypothetical protein
MMVFFGNENKGAWGKIKCVALCERKCAEALLLFLFCEGWPIRA